MDTQDMQLYSFVHSFLSPVQKGLQTAHLVNEFTIKYLLSGDPMSEEDEEKKQAYDNWSFLDKTIIILDGGDCVDMEQLRIIFDCYQNQSYPTAMFWEDDNSLKGMMTAVGIILPALFSTRADRAACIAGDIGTTFDNQLARILNKSKLSS